MKKKNGKEEKKEIKKNGFSMKAILGTALILITSISIFLIADALMPFRRFEMRIVMQNLFFIGGIVSTFIVLLATYLVYTYLRGYLELKSGITLSILVVVVSFLIFGISSNPILHAVLGIYGKHGAFAIVPSIFVAISLAVLVWVSSK